MEIEQRQRLAGLINSGNAQLALDQLHADFSDVDDIDFNFLCAIALQLLGRADEAERAYLAVLALNPDAVISRKNLALLYCEQHRNLDDAVRLFAEYLAKVPGDVACLRPYVNVLFELGRTGEALNVVNWFRGIYPTSDEVRRMTLDDALSNHRYLRGLFAASTFLPDRIAPDNIGYAVIASLLGVNAFDVARQISDALAALPETQGTVEQALSRATVELFSGNSTVAEAIYRDLLARGCEDFTLLQNLGLVLLEEGRYDEGWDFFSRANEHRPAHLGLREEMKDVPLWRGESLSGRTILVNPEQGMGDVIQFLRYIPILQESGVRMVLNVYPDILQLLVNDPRAEERQSLDIAELPTPDFQTYLMDLPSRLQLGKVEQIPAPQQYLYANPEKVAMWQERFKPYEGLKVAIAWAGNPAHDNDDMRSAALEDFESLAALPGVNFFSVQKGAGAPQASYPPDGMAVVDLGAEISDFSDTAAIFACVDLVIAVDTSVIHLAGAMGVPVWTLLAASLVDFRWQLAQETTPWYPSARLFRQEKPGDWRGLMREKVRPALAQIAREHFESGGVEAENMLPLAMLSTLVSPETLGTPLEVPENAPVSDAHLFAFAAYLRVGLYEDWGARLIDHCDRCKQWLARLEGAADALVQSAKAELAFGRGDYLLADKIFSSVDSGNMPRRGYARWVLTLVNQGQHADAMATAECGFECYPDDPLIWYAKGIALRAFGDKKAAIVAFKNVVRILPRHVNSWRYMANLFDASDFELSLDAYQRVICLSCDTDEVWLEIIKLAVIRRELNLAELLSRWLYQRLGTPAAALLLGESLARNGKLAEAHALLHSVDMAKCSDDDLSNAAYLAWMMGDVVERERWVAKFKPRLDVVASTDYAVVASTASFVEKGRYFDEAVVLLAEGNYSAGWLLYAAGIIGAPPGVDPNGLKIPEWKGESLSGKRLLIYQDQGSGDYIQFAALTQLLPKDCEVTFTFQGPALLGLFDQTPYARRSCLFADIDWAGSAFDYRLPLMRLPARVNADLLHPNLPYPYLPLPAQAQRFFPVPESGEPDLLKVGMIWAGANGYINNAWRSTALVDWTPLLSVENIRWISLQKDEASNQVIGNPGFNLDQENLVAECETFLQTAGLVSELDLLISVDSAMAHLGGALGVPTWVLIPCVGVDWRWGRVREDCPWYPSVRLFRQALGEPWSAVFERIAVALEQERESLCRSAQQRRASVPAISVNQHKGD